MAKLLKQWMVRELAQEFANVQDCYVVNYHGLTAEQAVRLRRELKEAGGRMKVVKNVAAAKAFEEVGLGEAAALLNGPSAVVAADEPIAVAKVLDSWAKAEEKPEIRGGYVSGKLLSPQEVSQLAKIPSREALLAQSVGVVSSPLRSAVSVVQALLRHVVCGAQALVDKGEPAENN